MSNKPKRSIANRLNRAQVAINNTLADTEILNRATEYGFAETKMQAGLALFQTAQGAVNARNLAQGFSSKPPSICWRRKQRRKRQPRAQRSKPPRTSTPR